ncbi:MAG TPA: fatty acid desaturase family protein [Paracoccaceae bacterium]|nr:fatty acid desaturase family protein [Paracoccaceae bacterium]
MHAATRDYSLVGRNARLAVEMGLASAKWYHTEIPRKEMKALMARRDGPAIRDTFIWVGALVLFGGLGAYLWPSWYALPFFLAYGVLHGSASDSRWHECGHGTAFKTDWMNNAVYQVASFMIFRNPVVWRWSHARHHTDTIIVGRDPEIAVMRPTDVLKVVAELFGLVTAPAQIRLMFLYATGRLDEEAATFVPESEHRKVFLAARIWLAIYAATFAAAIATGSLLPLMLAGLPRFYGAWHHVLCGYTQHAGLAENVLDHRLNSRTVYMNPVSRFIYWNMNYHVEHHMFPMVPYHALPRLHALIKHDLPKPYAGFLGAYAEMIPALWRQARNPDWHVRRELPPAAKPFRPEFHGMAPAAAE